MLTCFWLGAVGVWAQSVELSGIVSDPNRKAIPDATVQLRNHETGLRRETPTNADGLYSFSSLKPGTYQITIQAPGFRTVTRQSVVLNIGDRASLDAALELLHAQENIRVDADIPLVNSENASVGTVVDQKFVENMPLNGRSFQSLIYLTPGILMTRSYQDAPGQFSVNGQRTNTNYFTVDGVSSNFGSTASVNMGQTYAGAVPALTILGGTNGLLPVDAMQEFRVQTSSFSPEYGRTPGAQVSIVTRSGTNQFHGTAFYYLRNEIFDARNWFNVDSQPKPPLRQNQFGGAFGGPIQKDKTFFFASYEGLRLKQPQTNVINLLTQGARAQVAPVYQAFVNALPLPTGPVNTDGITAPYTYTRSQPARFDAGSIRLDHYVGSRTALFARYGTTPSEQGYKEPASLENYLNGMDALTGGVTSSFGATAVNDFRLNWSRSVSKVSNSALNFPGTAVPPDSAIFLPGMTPNDGQACWNSGFSAEGLCRGSRAQNTIQQWNFVDTLSKTIGLHQVKMGGDFRRILPTMRATSSFGVRALNYDQLLAGTFGIFVGARTTGASAKLDNYSLFGQDTWKLTPRLTVTYGLRWEVSKPPSSTSSSLSLYAVNGVFSPGTLGLATRPLWHTRYNNFAPRLGVAWWLANDTVIRAGVGAFYDLGYPNIANWFSDFPYAQTRMAAAPAGIPFDLNNPVFQFAPLTTQISSSTSLNAVDPNLRVPMTYQWNLAIERRLGASQSLSATYIGASGVNLLRKDLVLASSGNRIGVTHNADISHFSALQLQFQRRMSNGLQILTSYSLAKSEDTGSSDVGQGSQSSYVVSVAPSVGELRLPPVRPSDFDIRHSFSAAVSWQTPWLAAAVRNWVLDGIFRTNSAQPLNILYQRLIPNGSYNQQPDVVLGQPFWIPDANTPGGRRLNPAAFAIPSISGGNFSSNSLRGFGFTQLDAALRRRFRFNERISLEVRAEYFNVLNHPIFGPPLNQWGVGGNAPRNIFGQVTSTLNNALGGGALLGGQAAIYAPGGPRSGQFSVKLLF